MPFVGYTGLYPYLSFEINLPEFRPEGLQCIQVLAELAKGGRFNYASDCTWGLSLKEWLPADDFSSVLERCSERSIEVFWKTTLPGGQSEQGNA